MTHTIRLRFQQVPLDGIFYCANCPGEWRKVSNTFAWNLRGQVVSFAADDVVDARDL
jgi:hypothetical protein